MPKFGPWVLWAFPYQLLNHVQYPHNLFTTFAFFCGSQEYHDNIGDLDGPEEKERAQAKIQKFISAFWFL